MPQRTDTLDLGHLGLSSGAARRFDLHVRVHELALGGQRYAGEPADVPVRLDVARTAGSGFSLRLRFAATLSGPCMRCLRPAAPQVEVDVREIDQPGSGEELSSPYVSAGELDLAGWVHDALVLAAPEPIACGADCRGLCPRCGADLNAEPEHAHPAEPDPRWAGLAQIRWE